jgi:hypothetical protein
MADLRRDQPATNSPIAQPERGFERPPPPPESALAGEFSGERITCPQAGLIVVFLVVRSGFWKRLG